MFRSTGTFDRLLEKATSQLLLEPDWDTILQITDSIRQNDVQPKYAISAIKKKLSATNPNVIIFALQVLESCVKNCGAPIHHEIACKSFMEELRNIVKATTNDKVKNKVLEVIQTWAYAFRSESNYKAVQDCLNLMKLEGYQFPTVKYETDAMFTADSAPEWADGECCHRCRVQFSVVVRKHHCRNCGQIFCSKCSNHNSSIPKFGIEKEVRVCTTCFEKLQKSAKSDGGDFDSDLPAVYTKSSLSQQPQVPPSSGKSEQELQEEEELQLAIALSQSEAENKEKEKLRSTHSLLSASFNGSSNANEFSSSNKANSNNESSSDAELNKYLNRPYWEQKVQTQTTSETPVSTSTVIPSAPISVSSQSVPQLAKEDNKYQNGDSSDVDEFLSTLRSSVEIFINRMKSKSSRGRPISNDSSIQTLFMNLTAMHPQLLRYIQQQDEMRGYYEKLQDKLSQIKDAREALDALREDHEEKLRMQAEEAERQRQVMMSQKLEIMRKKKQEYLQYQRQLAMQRMQEQERELLMRQDQQIYQQPQPQGPGMLPSGVYVSPQSMQNQPGFSSEPPAGNSPVHGGTAYYQNPPGATQPSQYKPNNDYAYSVPATQPAVNNQHQIPARGPPEVATQAVVNHGQRHQLPPQGPPDVTNPAAIGHGQRQLIQQPQPQPQQQMSIPPGAVPNGALSPNSVPVPTEQVQAPAAEPLITFD